MKIIRSAILSTVALALIASCSSQKNTTPEIRFVDLQGNARPIKTRVPEANAKIMAGQNSNLPEMSPKIHEEYNSNQKNIANNTLAQRDRDLNQGNQKNNFADNNPRFSDADNFKPQEQNIYKNENPVVEYDLSKEGNSSREKSNKLSANNSTKEIALNDSNKEKNIAENQADSEMAEENDNAKFANSKNKKSMSGTKKSIITYSTKKVRKTNSDMTSSEGTADEQNAEDSSNSAEETNSDLQVVVTNDSVTASRGYYVQVGSFNNSKSAKNKVAKVKNHGKGKVIIGYVNNKRVYRSVFGPFSSRAKADTLKNKIIKSGNDAIVIRGK